MPEPDVKQQFGKNLKNRRHRLHLTQEQLAERANLHRTYLADIERGVRNPSLMTMAKLADGLGISLAALFTVANGLPAASESQVAIVSTREPAEILLVEDDPNDAELTRRAFQRAGIVNPVRVVHDGEEALDFVFCTGVYARRKQAKLPQVILLDLKLPRKNGLEVLRRLKADPRTKHIPVAVLTGSQRDRDIAESKRLGAEAYILKPVDFCRFTKVVPQMNFAWALLKSPTPRSG